MMKRIVLAIYVMLHHKVYQENKVFKKWFPNFWESIDYQNSFVLNSLLHVHYRVMDKKILIRMELFAAIRRPKFLSPSRKRKHPQSLLKITLIVMGGAVHDALFAQLCKFLKNQVGWVCTSWYVAELLYSAQQWLVSTLLKVVLRIN